MDIVTIDFETYYDKEYSLSKMTTEAYVRDPRFEVIGVGIKVNDHPTDWYSGDNVGRFLKSLDYTKRAILCHNTAFDGAILSWHYGIRPALWLDTLSMARPLHNVSVGGSLKNLVAYYKLGEKGDEVVNAMGMRRSDFTTEGLARYASYCVNDVELTYKLFRKMVKGFPSSELKLIDQTLRMYTEPTLEINTTVLHKHLEDILEDKTSLVDTLDLGCSEDEAKSILMSNFRFADFLRTIGVEPPMKRSKSTGLETFAFSKLDKAFTDLMNHPDIRVANAVAARLGIKSTIEETRTRSLLGVAERGTLPIMLNYYGAHTGRFSGGDKMNLQNLPRGGLLRRSITAPKGKVLIACDSAQIEARVVAWLAGQGDLLAAFAEGRDVYCEFASEVYGRQITKADKVERFVGKTCILGLGYGMGSLKFESTLAIGQAGISVKMEPDEAKNTVNLYRSKYHKITRLWSRCSIALSNMVVGKEFWLSDDIPSIKTGKDCISLPNKLVVRYPMLTRGENFTYAGDMRVYKDAVKDRVMGKPINTDKFTHIYGGKVTENVVQAIARIVVSEQMTKIGQRYKVVLQVHDEVVVLVDEHEAEAAKAFMLEVMSTPPSWALDLPVACEATIGNNYAECK